ncbi:MAG: aromatic ring-hydroxylating oxygenase subunit alpha, partial [Gammaproteobacteria bacterium]
MDEAPALALPAAFYLGEDRLATDLRAVLARGWQLVAHAADVAGIGDHVVTRVADAPVIVVRGDDG